jgi:TIM-barrel protein
MAGVTDGKFCSKMAKYGFDLVTLGGYNAENRSIEAGLKIIKRGRKEFHVDAKELIQHIRNEASYIKNQTDSNVDVSVNIRVKTEYPVTQISKIPEVDVVEINAHCRQPELVESGYGQALMNDPEHLHELISDIVRKSNKKVSVKIRANVPGVDNIEVANAVNDAGAHYLHVDAMKPGFDCADYSVIKSIKEKMDIFIIGNNSIRDLDSARNMLLSGADGISIARAAMHGKLSFDLSLI